MKKKFLSIAPHLSTGGSPRYLQWLIEEKIEQGYEVAVVEWNNISDDFVVHKKNILKLVGDNFLSVGKFGQNEKDFQNNVTGFLKWIENYNPDIVHFNEYSESFKLGGKDIPQRALDFLYDPQRRYKIVECSHCSASSITETNILKKDYMPDEFWFVSRRHYDLAVGVHPVKCKLVEIEFEPHERPDRSEALLSLGLDPKKFHVLQVGLISPWKNQKSIFELAEKFTEDNVQFHFVGNKCYLNKCEIKNIDLPNCKMWGERDDVESFMSCMDLFVMPSLRELNPIALKEAVSWRMKCFVSELDLLKEQYSKNKLVNFIKDDNLFKYINSNKNKFIDSSEILKRSSITSIKSFLEEFNERRLGSEIFDSGGEVKNKNKIKVTFNPKAKVDFGAVEKNKTYTVEFFDADKRQCLYKVSDLKAGSWCFANPKYYVNWQIKITDMEAKKVGVYNLKLKNKCVKVAAASRGLGDIIAWIPAIDRFQKKHNCILDFYTKPRFIDLLKDQYPNINFCDTDAPEERAYIASYSIACYEENLKFNYKNHWLQINLQDIASEILGVETLLERAKLKTNPDYKFEYSKYVCIATQTTLQAKYWNRPNGWSELIDYLHDLGYKVVCVDKHKIYGSNGSDKLNRCPDNVDSFVGDRPLAEVIDIINNSDFFIGLSSGLSWVANSLRKKTVIISGFVEDFFEFYTPYRVSNRNVCHACFNSGKHKFCRSDWMWCPENKDFECTKEITVEMVKEKVDKLINEN